MPVPAAAARLQQLSAHLAAASGLEERISCHLDGHDQRWRRMVFELLREPLFDWNHGLGESMAEMRRITTARLKRLMDPELGLFPQYGATADPAKYNQIFAALQFYDNAVLTLHGAQYFLYAAAIRNLGTEYHIRELLPAAETYKIAGCFALTELGHGSNARGLETTATFDIASQHFILHTPTTTAQKYWIGGGAENAIMAIIWAQLYARGVCYGVHAFVVQLRSADTLQPLPGIRIADCGHKMGVNGIDNGRFWFDNVRLPRTALLNRYADVTASGEYVSPIPDNDQRFAAHMGTLSYGRANITRQATQYAKLALTTAVRYAHTRRQFAPAAGGPERRLIDYPLHQRRLMPLLATTYAHHFMSEHLAGVLGLFAGPRLPLDRETQRLAHILSSGMKAIASWHQIETMQMCREACGGQGCKSSNVIAILKNDADVQATYEGDNWVLLQTVARAVRASQAATAPSLIFGDTASTDAILSAEFQQALFVAREQLLVQALQERLETLRGRGLDADEAWNSAVDVASELGRAHIERCVLDLFVERGERAIQNDAHMAALFAKLRALYALWRIDTAPSFLRDVRLLPDASTRARIHEAADSLCTELASCSLALVNAFGIPDHLLGDIAGDWVAKNA